MTDTRTARGQVMPYLARPVKIKWHCAWDGTRNVHSQVAWDGTRTLHSQVLQCSLRWPPVI